MRIYVPSTLPLLERALTNGEVGPAPVLAHAVTPALREWYAEGDLEELEYAAMTAAARASLRLLADDPEAEPRRVVLAVEASDAAVVAEPGDLSLAGDDRSLVRVAAPVPMTKIVSVHIDDPEAGDDVRAAAAALAAADAGDLDAQFIVDGAEGHELMWYATQELRHLLG